LDEKTKKMEMRPHEFGLKTRLQMLVGFWEDVTTRENAPKTFKTGRADEQGITKDIWRPYRSAAIALEKAAPPAYEDAIWDLPPDYTATDACAHVLDLRCGEARIEHGLADQQEKGERKQLYEVGDVKVNFSATDNIRSRANKKAKKVSGG
jgi:hypothetical protein